MQLILTKRENLMAHASPMKSLTKKIMKRTEPNICCRHQAVELVYDRYDSDYEAEQPDQEANPTSGCKKGWLSNLENIDGLS